MAAVPETRYAKSGEVHIAYQVVGEGPFDMVFVPGFVSNVEAVWSSPPRARFLQGLASFCRLILFDKRGTGMSDRTSQIFTLEQRMEDVHAVMDAAGSERAALFGFSEGGPMSILFAATYPKRTRALVFYGSYAKRSWGADYPFGWTSEQWDAFLANMEENWGKPDGVVLDRWAPSIARDEQAATAAAAYFRASASPGAALAVMKMNREIDVRNILPSVHVPTLIMHRVDERVIHVDNARYMARRIPGAKLVELPGIDHMPWVGDFEPIVQETAEFLTGTRHVAEPERELATVQFIDIVQSTERAAALGDRQWRELLEGFQSLVRESLRQHRGREIDTAGDGFLAAFDGPARAIRCAAAVRERARAHGIELRAGVHTGECEIIGEKLGGIAVHTGSRVAGKAEPGEILVSQTVKDLVAGSGLQFAERGVHSLKGVPGEWRLYAFTS
jgi:pimeloyl-ACP methyl ester carboxylesterase/class 3 adenylate cyclase